MLAAQLTLSSKIIVINLCGIVYILTNSTRIPISCLRRLIEVSKDFGTLVSSQFYKKIEKGHLKYAISYSNELNLQSTAHYASGSAQMQIKSTSASL